MLSRELQLAYELEAVLIDAENGKFDRTCMNTIRYVAQSLRSLSEHPKQGETPMTDALTMSKFVDSQHHREALADHARRLESALAVAEEQLSSIADFTTGYADVAGIVNTRAREALRAIEQIKGGV